jgi:beta-lactamase class D
MKTLFRGNTPFSTGEESEMADSIFNQYIEKRKVITKNKKVLQTTYVPNVLPHRSEQIERLASIISIALNGEKPSNIMVYGKTGTGRVDGQDVNGWFIGYIETADNTYFFATNIGADSDATGGNATEISMSILSDMNIWK